MKIIDADKFLGYLIFSKHIDGLTCGEVKEAIEMCKVDDVFDKIKAEINRQYKWLMNTRYTIHDVNIAFGYILGIIDRYKADKENEE